jgi:NADP-dependent 3-hydroxy acid dehydrogenase YdfG/tetratricopeptide (TPR) repeat protein
MTHIHLAFCHLNSNLADILEDQLPNIQCIRHSDSDYSDTGSLMRSLVDTEGLVLLLITDNFMKSEQCMSGALATMLSLMRQNRVVAIIANGIKTEDGVTLPVETHIDRVVNAIQYMNYWQQKYLAISDQYNHANDQDQSALFLHQQIIHDVADQTGEFISALRDSDIRKWEILSASGFSEIYKLLGIPYQPIVGNNPILPEREHESPQASTATPMGGPVMFRPAEPIVPVTQDPVQEFVAQPNIEPEEIIIPPVPETSFSDGFKFDPSLHLIDQTKVEESPETHDGNYRESEIQYTINDALTWIARGNRELGLEVFRVALEQYPNHEQLRQEYEKAQITGQEPIEENSENDAHAYEAAGDSAFNDGDFLMAKYCWDRAAENNPNLNGIWKKLGLMTSDQLTGYTETSIAYLKKSLAQIPDDQEVIARLISLGEVVTMPEQQEDVAEVPELEAIVVEEVKEIQAAAQDDLPSDIIAEAAITAISEPLSAPILSNVQPEPLVPEQDSEPLSAPMLSTVQPEPLVPEQAADIALQYQPMVTNETVSATSTTPHFPPQRNEIVLITGATSGIGKATAIEFARHGYRLIITGRRAELLFDLRNQLETDFGVEVLPLVFDVRDQRAVEGNLTQLPESWRAIDILINNAGLAKGLAPIHEGELHHWETMIDTNIKGLLYVSQIISRGMVERRKGHIVNLSSSAGKEAYPNGNVYCATKFAVEALTKSMRFDLYKFGIRVSQVSPGHVEDTEFALNRFDGDPEKAKIYNDFQPLTATDVAEAIWFIASRPAHVNVQDVYMFGTQQASATVVDRSGRGDASKER